VDAPAKIDQSGSKGSSAEIDSNNVTPALIEGEKGRRLAAGRSALSDLADETLIQQFCDQARYCCAGEPGLAGDFGSTGLALVRDELKRGSEIAATGVVLGGLDWRGNLATPIPFSVISRQLTPMKVQ
jgi:hypothetical protein